MQPNQPARPSIQQQPRLSSSISRQGERLQVTFNHLTYTVRLRNKELPKAAKKSPRKEGKKYVEKNILDNIDGVFQPGRLTAVIGSSGAGKTTLLSVIAGEVTSGVIEGSIKVNGEDWTERNMREISGFVFQDDILLETMTVREAIHMSALLRLPKGVGKEERTRRIGDVIEMLHLQKAADTQIGSTAQKGISGGERKRVSIAMEVVTNPAMIFLDEPTSGLDTYTAYSVMKMLKQLAHRQGRTVVATIHQPSSEIYHLFDDLLILARGRVMYYGTAQRAIDYFAERGYQCPTYTNPSDYFFMNVLKDVDDLTYEEEEEAAEEGRSDRHPKSRHTQTGQNTDSHGFNSTVRDDTQNMPGALGALGTGVAGGAGLGTAAAQSLSSENGDGGGHNVNTDDPPTSEQRINHLLGEWDQSSDNQKMMDENVSNPSQEGISGTAIRHRAPFMRQFWYLLNRASKNAIRNRMIVFVRLFQAVYIGLIIGLVYLDINSRSPAAQVQDRAGVLFFFSIYAFFASSNSVLTIFSLEKQVFYREYRAGYYSLPAYFITKVLVEIPYEIIFPFLLVLIPYYMIGLKPAFSAYLLAGLFVALTAICGTAFGILIASTFENIRIATAVLPIVILPFVLFSGLYANSQSTPGWLRWLKYLSPMYYGFVGLTKNELSGRTLENCDETKGDRCSGDEALAQYGFNTGTPSIGLCIILLIVIYLVLIVLAFVVLFIQTRTRYKKSVKSANNGKANSKHK